MGSIEEDLAQVIYREVRQAIHPEGSSWKRLTHEERVIWRGVAEKVFEHLAVAASQPEVAAPAGYVRVHGYLRKVGHEPVRHVQAGTATPARDRPVLARDEIIKTRPDLGQETAQSLLRSGDGPGRPHGA